jgi:hypothetical protein
MAKKRTARRQPPPPVPAAERSAVTAERFSRLYRLVQYLAAGPKPRARLTHHLGIDVRGFYRDLELLRAAGIVVALDEGQYRLQGPAEEALARLPFPDPHLTLGEARQLALGRSAAHRHLRDHIGRVVR